MVQIYKINSHASSLLFHYTSIIIFLTMLMSWKFESVYSNVDRFKRILGVQLIGK
jgi:hypothetical protein